MNITKIHPEDEHQNLNITLVNEEQQFRKKNYSRDKLEDDVKGQTINGSYQRYLHGLGDCCGFMRTIIPCCCCVDYPYFQVEQGYMGIFLRFGKYIKTVNPGLHYVNPCTDKMLKVNTKLQMIDCKKQWVMTKDNLLIEIDATVYFRLNEPKKAIFYIYDVRQAINQLTLATIKSVVGNFDFEDILAKRQEVQREITAFIDENVDDWGVDIENMLITDIALNHKMKSALSVAATAERAAKAKILEAEANVKSAKLMREAAALLESKAAMQIRFLETLQNVGSQDKTKVILLKN